MSTDQVAKREKGWENRFLSLVTAEMSQPFDWTNSNCTDLMATSIYACYGPNHPVLAELRSLEDADTVKEYLKSKGGLSNILGQYFDEVPTSFAKQADLGIFIGQGDIEVGMVIVDGMAIGKSEQVKPMYGFYVHRLPIHMLSKVYRV